MPYYKIDLPKVEIVSDQITFPPDEIHGLDDDHLADLGATFPSRPEFQGVGYWPETRIIPSFDADTHALGPDWVPVADPVTRTVTSTQQVVPLTADQIRAVLIAKRDVLAAGVQAYIDSVAKARRYDSMERMVGYRGDRNLTYAAEAAAGADWRSMVWEAVAAIDAQVEQGAIPVPTLAELIAMLPAPPWPPAE